ncbi:hypothetical protein HPP92_000036 [Vanilla planifolia]|uniref:Uncharacterized protein n=1 Tax=Vanilla planifolia TaxID=51239 RepID=A0A835RVN4_VANPL|nr:hypothetical protein HPP92_000036 [Vanilla planifolia]
MDGLLKNVYQHNICGEKIKAKVEDRKRKLVGMVPLAPFLKPKFEIQEDILDEGDDSEEEHKQILQISALARIGLFALIDVAIPLGNTSFDYSQTLLFQADVSSHYGSSLAAEQSHMESAPVARRLTVARLNDDKRYGGRLWNQACFIHLTTLPKSERSITVPPFLPVLPSRGLTMISGNAVVIATNQAAVINCIHHLLSELLFTHPVGSMNLDALAFFSTDGRWIRSYKRVAKVLQQMWTFTDDGQTLALILPHQHRIYNSATKPYQTRAIALILFAYHIGCSNNDMMMPECFVFCVEMDQNLY